MKIKDKILTQNKIELIAKSLKKKKKTIVFCSGCYDVLHSGHVIFFEQCRKFGDILIVSVGRDEPIKKQKGPGRPVNPENNRLFLVAALESVDFAILGQNEILPGKIDFYNIVEKLRPDIFVLNDNDSAIAEKRELCRKFGIKLKLVKRIVPKFLVPTSSTEIVEKINKL